MKTTIQISDLTKQRLNTRKSHGETYDQVIQKLLSKPGSMFGSSSGSGWKKEYRLDF